MNGKTWIVAIAGGSGSGKTTLAKQIQHGLASADPKQKCAILGQDSYYIDQSHKFDRDGGAVNFDHPESLEFSLLAEHIRELKEGRGVQVPIYDFPTHKRLNETEPFEHHSTILVDGTLILSQPALLPLFDEAIFLEIDEETRFERRLKRDVEERGRTPDGVREQFFKQVKVMHDEFVEPSKENSSILIRASKSLVIQKKGCPLRDRILEILQTQNFTSRLPPR